MTSVALRNPVAVSCFSGERNTTEATKADWKSPSEDWLTSRMAKSLRKSGLPRAPRIRSSVPGPVFTEPSGYPSTVESRGYASVGWTSKNRVQSWSSACPLPRMKLSTMSRAASSENCTGGDFMK
jgi:hypothetical protein